MSYIEIESELNELWKIRSKVIASAQSYARLAQAQAGVGVEAEAEVDLEVEVRASSAPG